MKWASLFLILLSFSAYGQRRGSFKMDLGGSAGIWELKKENAMGSNFNGMDFHFGLEVMMREAVGRYDAGFLIRGLAENGANSKNGAGGKETINGNMMELGARLYALDLFLGAGLSIGQRKLKFETGGVETETKYADYGAYVETGIGFLLGSRFSLSPFLKYRYLKSEPLRSADSSMNSNQMDLGLSLGLEF